MPSIFLQSQWCFTYTELRADELIGLLLVKYSQTIRLSFFSGLIGLFLASVSMKYTWCPFCFLRQSEILRNPVQPVWGLKALSWIFFRDSTMKSIIHLQSFITFERFFLLFSQIESGIFLSGLRAPENFQIRHWTVLKPAAAHRSWVMKMNWTRSWSFRFSVLVFFNAASGKCSVQNDLYRKFSLSSLRLNWTSNLPLETSPIWPIFRSADIYIHPLTQQRHRPDSQNLHQ